MFLIPSILRMGDLVSDPDFVSFPQDEGKEKRDTPSQVEKQKPRLKEIIKTKVPKVYESQDS